MIMTDITDAELTGYLRRFKAYAEDVPAHHLKKQMKAWDRRRDQNTLQLVLCCGLGDVFDVWQELGLT